MTDEEMKNLFHTDRKAFFMLIGAKGGKAKVSKGFGKMPKKKRLAAAKRGGSARASV